MDKLIRSRWKILPEDQRSGIRNFIVSVIVKSSSDEASLRKEKSYINKLNLILVQILKQEWPHNWPTFIPEIVTSSQANLSICENNMVILKLLSEEIFEFSAEQMTTAKTKALKAQIVSGECTAKLLQTQNSARPLHAVSRVCRRLQSLCGGARKGRQGKLDQNHLGSDAAILELDSPRLHFRDPSHR